MSPSEEIGQTIWYPIFISQNIFHHADQAPTNLMSLIKTDGNNNQRPPSREHRWLAISIGLANSWTPSHDLGANTIPRSPFFHHPLLGGMSNWERKRRSGRRTTMAELHPRWSEEKATREKHRRRPNPRLCGNAKRKLNWTRSTYLPWPRHRLKNN